MGTIKKYKPKPKNIEKLTKYLNKSNKTKKKVLY